MKQKRFKVGDIVELDDTFNVKIVRTFRFDGEWWYEVVPVEFKAISREVPEERLKALREED